MKYIYSHSSLYNSLLDGKWMEVWAMFECNYILSEIRCDVTFGRLGISGVIMKYVFYESQQNARFMVTCSEVHNLSDVITSTLGKGQGVSE